MPEPTPSLSVDMSDAPTGDALIESLFPAEETVGEVAATPAATPPADASQPQTPPASEFFLKTSTGTVYKTAEEAIRGTEHKDATIQELRRQVQQATGQDPLARRSRQPEVVSYLQHPERYYEDTESAVKAGDKVKFAQATQRMVDETIAARLGPYAPVLDKLAVRDAQDTAGEQVKGLREFVRSDAYRDVLKENPTLRNAIRNAETNPVFRWQNDEETGQVRDALPELYRLAYQAAEGSKVPALLTQGRGTAAPNPPQRQTLQTGHVADVRTQVDTEPGFATSEGRKAIIERARARGVENMTF
jgi:hypothetical protein